MYFVIKKEKLFSFVYNNIYFFNIEVEWVLERKKMFLLVYLLYKIRMFGKFLFLKTILIFFSSSSLNHKLIIIQNIIFTSFFLRNSGWNVGKNLIFFGEIQNESAEVRTLKENTRFWKVNSQKIDNHNDTQNCSSCFKISCQICLAKYSAQNIAFKNITNSPPLENWVQKSPS